MAAIGAVSAPADPNGVVGMVVGNGPAPNGITVTEPRTNAVGGKLFGRVQAVK